MCLMSEMKTREIIDLWPDRQALAQDLEIPLSVVRSWYHRQRIPPERYEDVVTSARRRDLGLTYEILARARSARQPGEAA